MEAKQTFRLKNGKEITVDFLDVKNLMSIKKSDMRQVKKQLDLALAYFRGDKFVWTDSLVMDFAKVYTKGSYDKHYKYCKTIEKKLVIFKQLNG
jgi:hypothetical protein